MNKYFHKLIKKKIFYPIMTVSVVISLATLFYISPIYKKIILEQSEKNIVKTATLIANVINPENREFNEENLVANLDFVLSDLTEKLKLESIQLISNTGKVIYPSIQNNHSYRHVTNIDGSPKISSRYLPNMRFAETFIPIVNNEKYLGAVTISYDFGDEINNLFYLILIICSAIIIPFLFLTFFYSLNSYRKDKAIIKQKDAVSFEKKLRQAQKMEAIGTLAGKVAHDFNNIVSAISGYTEKALMETKKGSSIDSYLQDLKTATTLASDFSKQILSFSTKTKGELKHLRIKEVTIDSLNFLKSTLPSTIEIEQKLNSDSSILADHSEIRQIFLNLCTNAAQEMMKKGGGKIYVQIDDIEVDSHFANWHPSMKTGPHIKISITDTGQGITPDVVTRIFEPFFSTKEGKGTGLGLSVVHGIVKRSNGIVTVYSEIGKGTTFNVFLPTIDHDSKTESSDESTIKFGNERILFVDDDLSLVEIGKKQLGSLGYKVVALSSSKEAFKVFEENPNHFDLVISDINMPEITGVELSKKINDKRSDIPIILCTGFNSTINVNNTDGSGIKAVLSKPLLRKEISKIIREVLDLNFSKRDK